MFTVADRVKLAPAAGLLLLTDGAPIARSGWTGSGTVTCTDAEQLLVVSDSPATASTHAP